MATPQILELAATISHSTGMLNEILTAKGHPTPSFAEDAPRSLPKEAVAAQDAILDATAELHELLLDPLGLLFRNGGVRRIEEIMTHRAISADHHFLSTRTMSVCKRYLASTWRVKSQQGVKCPLQISRRQRGSQSQRPAAFFDMP